MMTRANPEGTCHRLRRPPLAALCIGAAAWLMLAVACAAPVVDGRAIADEQQGANWLSTGRTYAEHHYSPLTGINDRNVTQLGLAWFLDLPGQRTLHATPLAVDGVLYFSGTHGRTFAVDARRGQKLWEFDPELAKHAPDRLRILWGAHRGVAYWRGKVYVGTVDGRLVALEATTGRVVWSVQTFDEPMPHKTISGAPRVFNGKVLIGHSGDWGSRGYVTAYDAESGRQVWRFYTVPGDPAKGFENAAMAMAAKTWGGQWWKFGGNGTVWDAITYDPEFNRVYLGTANGTPINPAIRSPGGGDNLFLCSIVALDAETGSYVWHYQLNPRDALEYDATQQMVLAELTIGGTQRKVLMQAAKNGFFYVVDRATGKLLSAGKFSKATWAERIDLATGRPVEIPNVRYEQGPVVVWPWLGGAHSWQPMAFHPGTGLVYIPTMKLGMRIGPVPRDEVLKRFGKDRPRYSSFPQTVVLTEVPKKDADDFTSGLVAWDPVTQTKRWEVQYPDGFWNGGTLATAGNLVFQGTGRGQFIAYDARTGARLWSFDAGLGIDAAPMTYAIDGVQYISVLVGYGGQAGMGTDVDPGWRFNEQPRRLLTFALGKQTPLPPGKPPRFQVKAVDDPALVIDAAQAAEGAKLFGLCGHCHGAIPVNAPDLRESTVAMNWEAFKAVLREGRLAARGMPKFDDLSDAELRALYMYIRQRAREAARSSR